MSQDNNLLALLYCSASINSGRHSKDRYDINIWKIVKGFDSEDVSKPWCEILKSMSYSSTFRGYSPQPILADSHNVLHHLWGQVDLHRLISNGITNDIGNDEPNAISRLLECHEGLDGMSLNPDDPYLIGLELQDLSIVRYITDNTSLHSSVTISVREAMLCAISYSGDFVIWRDMGSSQHSCYLHDFVRDKCTRLLGSEEIGFSAHLNLESL